jgi:photosystem II stability/assembly factor-like uncharacterized protein
MYYGGNASLTGLAPGRGIVGRLDLPPLTAMRLRSLLPALGVALIAPSLSAQSTAVTVDSSQLSALRWRYIGPVGNRVASVAGVPGDFNTYYAGAASGGIWKTTDAGIHWSPIFDDKDVNSIGALAVAPSNANIVWAGTGEPWIRSHISVGNGVYKSTDAGRTWTKMGLEASGRVGRIAIDPANPDIVLIAAQGHSYGPQKDRGIYRTADGGKTWTQVLFVDENTGGIDVVMDPSNSRKIFAATWQFEMHTYGRESGGPGSAIWLSNDGGLTFARLRGNGLPTHDIGKISIAIARSNPNRVYALIETGDGVPMHGKTTDNGELWRSDDGGTNWRVVSFDRNLGCRQPYYTRTVVSTDAPDELYFMCATFSRSLDGGMSAQGAGGGGGRAGRGGGGAAPLATPGGDNHDMWIDPTNANRMAVANDAGVSISTTRGRSWNRINLPIAQIYHVTTDVRVPYYVYGNKQDGPSYRGPSNSRTGGQIARSEWHGVEGGESGWATPDTVDQNIIWSTASGSGARGGIVVRYDLRARQGQNVEVYPLSTGGHPADAVKYRFVWDAPFLISPHDHNTVFTGSQMLHKSSDGGRTWQVISPDLTRNDKSKQGISGGLTPDNIGVEYADVVYAINESPIKAGVIWVGTNDGLVQLTRDAGATWTNVTANVPGIPPLGSVRHVEPSKYDVASAYIIVDAHQENNRDPWIYRTRDFGKTWTLIVNGIPKSPLSYVHIIREDPVRRGLLYAGTENTLYVSFDDGDHWQPLKSGLPSAPVYGMVIQPHFDDLVIGTYGRGFFILDDLSPLQKLTQEIAASDAHFFAPRPAYRFTSITGNYSTNDDPTAGNNPPYGAALNYWLKARTKVTFDIKDATGKVIRTITDSTTQAGLNRTYWDIRNTATQAPRARTKPMYNAEFAMNTDSTRDVPGFGSISVLMPPGKYTVVMTANGRSFTQPLEILRDPNQRETVAEIRLSAASLMALQKELTAVAEMITQIESVRSQAQAITNADVRAAADSLERKFIDVESTLFDPRLTGRGQDETRYPARYAQQISYLAGDIGASDFAPTNSQKDVAVILVNGVRTSRATLDNLLSKDLKAFNALLQSKGLKAIVVDSKVVF